MHWHQVLTVARKAGVAALGAVAAALAAGLLPDPWDKVGAAVVAVGTYLGVYATPNKPPMPDARGRGPL